MNCHDFDTRIQQLLDDRQSLSGDAELNSHAQHCANCEESLAAYDGLLRATQQLSRPVLSSGFAARVVAQVRSEPVELARTSETSQRQNWLAPVVAIAALLLLAVGVGTWANWNRVQRGDVATTQPDGGAGEKPATVDGVVGIAVPGRVAKSKSAPAAKTGQPGNELVLEKPQTVQPQIVDYPLPPVSPASGDAYYDYRSAIESLAMQLPGAVEHFDSMEMYAPGIRPIRESFSTAFETLWRTFPGRADARSGGPPQAWHPRGSAAEIA
jgi:hypothetical protein